MSLFKGEDAEKLPALTQILQVAPLPGGWEADDDTRDATAVLGTELHQLYDYLSRQRYHEPGLLDEAKALAEADTDDEDIRWSAEDWSMILARDLGDLWRNASIVAELVVEGEYPDGTKAVKALSEVDSEYKRLSAIHILHAYPLAEGPLKLSQVRLVSPNDWPVGFRREVVKSLVSAVADPSSLSRCDQCGHIFVPRRAGASVCSLRCRNRKSARVHREKITGKSPN